MRSPTSKSLTHLRKSGYICAVVERWNPYAGARKKNPKTGNVEPIGIRQDLFGIFDILAVGHGTTVAVQSTSKDGMRARYAKITGRNLNIDKLPDDKAKAKALQTAAKIREAVLACLGAGWTIAIYGHVPGTGQPLTRFITEDDLFTDYPQEQVEAPF